MLVHAPLPALRTVTCTTRHSTKRGANVPANMKAKIRDGTLPSTKTFAVVRTTRRRQPSREGLVYHPLQAADGRRQRHLRDCKVLAASGDGPQMVSEERLQKLMKDLPLVLDVRDPGERSDPSRDTVPGSVNVPLNMDGLKQSQRATTIEEFKQKLDASGALPAIKSSPIITHCGSGGRGDKARQFLEDLGYTNVFNGGTPERIVGAITSSPAAAAPEPKGKDPFGFGDSSSNRPPTAEEKGSNMELGMLILGTTVGSVLLLFLIFLAL